MNKNTVFQAENQWINEEDAEGVDGETDDRSLQKEDGGHTSAEQCKEVWAGMKQITGFKGKPPLGTV